MAFKKEPEFTHGGAARVGVLYCNLGTPDAPTASALRRYLAEFLSDHRVVEIPKLVWWFILHGIILRLRPAKSAKKYASVWMAEGSPLRVWTEKQAAGLAHRLHAAAHANVMVKHGMRYGQPSIGAQLDAFKAEGCTKVLVLPAYPQYSGTTTASVFDAVYAWAAKTRRIPELRFVNHFHDHTAHIDALAASAQAHFDAHGMPQKLVLSFHGVPERTLHLGDPYHCECHKTARLLRERLGLAPEQVQLTFQSRFGKAKWLEPYTEPTLVKLAQSGTTHVAVMCPGFTADCLETLEEIQMEAKEAFVHAGGKRFDYIACLNDSDLWLDGLSTIATQHMQGWPTQAEHNEGEIEAQRELALRLGARA